MRALTIIRRICICEYILNIDSNVGYYKTTTPSLNVIIREIMLDNGMIVKYSDFNKKSIVITITI